MALAATTEHLVVVHPKVGDDDLGVTGAAVHGLDLAHVVPALLGQVDDEGRVRRLRDVGILLGAAHEDREARPPGVRR